MSAAPFSIQSGSVHHVTSQLITPITPTITARLGKYLGAKTSFLGTSGHRFHAPLPPTGYAREAGQKGVILVIMVTSAAGRLCWMAARPHDCSATTVRSLLR